MEAVMNFKTVVHEPEFPIKGNAILFTGRGGSAESFIEKYEYYLKETRLIAIQPISQWYPMPNGMDDQEDAIKGLNKNIGEIKNHVDEIIKEFDISLNELVFIGYSAGSVVALQLITNYDMNIAFAFLHSGALFEPESLKECSVKTPFMLIHSSDDNCFSWEERYLPMKNAMIAKNYNLFFLEKKEDGHAITDNDLYFVSSYISNLFKYSDSIPYKFVDLVDSSVS